MTRSILCGVDGSTYAREALGVAARLSAQLEARLVAAHVVQVPVQSTRLGSTAVPIGGELEAGRDLLGRILEEERLSHVERRVEYGFPADRLADLADDEAAELIVVGSRGRGTIKAALLGSVSTDVIGVARCPVLVVPPGAADPALPARSGGVPAAENGRRHGLGYHHDGARRGAGKAAGHDGRRSAGPRDVRSDHEQ